jgi:hypothetical protein
MNRRFLISCLLLALVYVEVRCQTSWLQTYPADRVLVSWGYALAGLLIGILPLIKLRAAAPKLYFLNLRSGLLIWPVLIWLGYLLVTQAQRLFAQTPVSYQVADMLPVITRMCERLLAREEIYAIIPEIWGGMQPIYLPAMWLPFVPTTLLELDPRWTTVVALLLAMLLAVGTRSLRALHLNSPFVLIPLFFLLRDMLVNDTPTLSMTEEPVVVLYYVLLGFALYRRNPYLIGAMLALCALSRYSLALWAVMYVLWLFFWVERRRALLIAGVSAALGLLLMLLFQGFSKLDVILNLQSTYLDAIVTHQRKYEATIQEGLGLAKLFAYQDLPTLHRLHLISALVVPALLLGMYHWLRKHLHQPFFALCSLKICLVFFYNLLIMPYLYLFYTSTFLSLVLLSGYLNQGSNLPPRLPGWRAFLFHLDRPRPPKEQ